MVAVRQIMLERHPMTYKSNSMEKCMKKERTLHEASSYRRSMVRRRETTTKATFGEAQVRLASRAAEGSALL